VRVYDKLGELSLVKTVSFFERLHQYGELKSAIFGPPRIHRDCCTIVICNLGLVYTRLLG